MPLDLPNWSPTRLPPPRRRAVPWTAAEMVAAVFLVQFFWPAFAATLVTTTGLGEWVYGREVMDAVFSQEPGADLARPRVGLLITLLAFPFQVLTIPLVFGYVSRTRPYQLGLTGHRAGQNVACGVAGALVLTPLALGIFWLAAQALVQLMPDSVTEHPLEKLGRSGMLAGAELALIVLVATVTAPVVEELVFRGVLLTWLSRRAWGGDVAMGLALLSALPARSDRWRVVLNGNWAERLQVLAPALFVLVLIPGYVCIRVLQKTPFPTALYGTSLLFGMMHAFAWPSPAPLFVLALGLGWLAQRTQSLVGPIVLHSLFNGVACVQLLLL